MLAIAIGVIIFLVLMIVTRNEDSLGLGDRILISVGLGFVGFVLGFMVLLISQLAVGDYLPTAYILKQSQPIVAMNSESGLHGQFGGSFLIAYGKLDSSLDYTYFIQNADSSLQAKQITATNDDVFVYQDMPKDQGRLDTFDCVQKVRYDWEKTLLWWTDQNCGVKHNFHIPQGTLVQQFTLQP